MSQKQAKRLRRIEKRISYLFSTQTDIYERILKLEGETPSKPTIWQRVKQWFSGC